MTFFRPRIKPAAARRRRNRRRTAPIWRRLPELAAQLGRLEARLRRALPVSIIAVATAALVASLCYGYRFINTSDRFAIRSIDVSGNRVVSTERIAALMGVGEHDNIFAIEPDELARSVQGDPWIARATVRRGLPDSLIVEVVENRPAVVVELGGLYLADATGKVFKRAAIERGEGVGLPIVTGLLREDYVERPDEVQESIRDALSVFALFQSGENRPTLGEIHLHPRHGTTLLTHDDAVAVRLGRGDGQSLRRRLRTFDRVWQALTPAERRLARTIYADDSSSRSHRVTVAFAEIE